MDDALFVRRFEGLCDLPCNRQGITDGQWPASDEIRQRVSLDQFHDEPRQAVNGLQAVHCRDMRMIKRGKELCFALEACQTFLVVREHLGQYFDCHVALQVCVAGLVDLTHPTGAEQVEDFIRPEMCSG